MSVRKTLPISAAAFRIITIQATVLSFYNPSSLSVVRLLQVETIPGALRLMTATAYGVTLIVLARQAWCGFRSLGIVVSILFALTILATTLTLTAGLLTSIDGMVFVLLIYVALLIGIGQVTTYYTRQLAGQSGSIKEPP